MKQQLKTGAGGLGTSYGRPQILARSEHDNADYGTQVQRAESTRSNQLSPARVREFVHAGYASNYGQVESRFEIRF